MEKIVQIKECKTKEGFEGYEVITTKQSIKMLIDNHQSCCEQWGYFWCNDSFDDFIGADLLDVKISDDALNEAKMKENDLDPNCKYFEGGVMFVNLETSKGTLQFVAYNEHNGYYGHEAKVQCKQLQYEVVL